MKNIISKTAALLLFLSICIGTFASTATFGFESTSELTNNFTYTCENANGSMAIATDVKKTGSSSLKATMGGTGQKSNFLITKQSYSNISEITLQLAASDKGKTSFAIEYCADAAFSSGVQSIQALELFTSLPGVPASPSNKTMYQLTYTLSTPISGYLRFTFRQPSSSGKFLWMDDLSITYSAAPVISSDATLSGLTYNGVSVPSFSAATTSYEVELPAGTTAVPTVVATVNESHASAAVTSATSLPGTTSVLVTAEDGSTQTYTITFTIASAAPKVQTATWGNIKGTATVDNVNMTITGQVLNGTGLTGIEPQFTGNNIASWTPTGPQDFSTGAVSYTFTSPTNETTHYSVTITEAPAVSTDATLSDLKVNGTTVSGFAAGTTTYAMEVSATAAVPTVSATANESHATVNITQATGIPGVATVVVTAEDGTTIRTYTVNFNVAVPSSGLTTHGPDLYDADKLDGGYGTPLVLFGGREYEVYYASYIDSSGSPLCISTQPTRKTPGITYSISTYHCKANDGWVEMSTTTSKSDYSMTQTDEFQSGSTAIHKLLNDGYYKMDIQGFDQFSFYGKDNNATESKGKHFEVYIDGVKQTMTLANSATIRRFNISTAHHVIEVRGVGASNNEFYGFSLRCGTDPRVKHIIGNDSTQEVLQTLNMKPITYYTKYNNGNATVIEWDNGVNPGFELNITGSDNIGDTLELSGVAQGPTGVYPYHIVTYKDGVQTSSLPGTIRITSQIVAKTDTIIDAFTGEDIDEIEFRYYALSGEDVTLVWTGATPPTGITTRVDEANHRFFIEGVPTTAGSFTFKVTVLGGNSITGRIDVGSSDLGANPVLYLFKNKDEYLNDDIYNFLRHQYNLVPRKAKTTLREASQYAPYVAIVASEFVDADNEELIALAKGEEISKPMLNMKAFSYSASRLGWGDPDNGSVVNKSITVMQEQHPVMQALNTAAGSSLAILDAVSGKGLMPVHVTYQGTLCIATAKTRSINYEEDGEDETFLHEVPAELRGGAKYLCFPLATNSSNRINGIGKRLLTACMDYLLNDQPSVALPELKITAFSIDGHAATIDQTANTIRLKLPEGTDATSLQPDITLADAQKTFVTPASGESIDFSDRYHIQYGMPFTVSDYINVRVYTVFVEVEQPQGLEEVYSVGDWVDIYDITGRKVLTTNEDIFRADLPRGMYLIATPRGTVKVMR